MAEEHGRNDLRKIDWRNEKGQPVRPTAVGLRCAPIPDGYNWTLNRSFYLEKADDLDYAMELIEQAYHDVI